MQVIVNNLLTHYEIHGSGPTILFVHGWADRLETFKPINAELGKHYKLLALDLPGFGQTEAPKTIWNLDDYAQFIADFINKVGIQENILAIVAHSNGGAVTIRGIALSLLMPKKLVLLAASGIRDSAKIRRLAIKTVAKTGKVATFWLPRQARKRLQKKLYGTVGSDMLVAPALQETFKRTVRQDIQKDAKNINLPTLLIYGDQDKATPLESIGQKLQKLIKDSRLEVVKDADHFVHHANPSQVSSIIMDFLNK
jgi:pimeloyl-ACP methyl ester carboxylesterase